MSVVIPCYNEFLNLDQIIYSCNKIKNKNKKYNFEFILVNNGSTDNTGSYLKKIKNKNFKVVSINKNIGYGHGILEGLKQSSHEILAWTHADLQTEISDICEGLKYLHKDFILIKGKRINRRGVSKILSLGMSIYTFLKLGVWLNEINAQPKIFRKKFFKKIQKDAPRDFSLDLFICLKAKKHGMIKEFPVYFNERKHGEAKGGGGSLSQKVKIISRTINYINKIKYD